MSIPDQFLRPPKNSYSYRPGWVAPDGTLHSCPSHVSFKARGFTTANRKHKRAKRDFARKTGYYTRGMYFSDISTYHHNWEKGYLRLTVNKKQVVAEYNTYRSADDPPRPPIQDVLTPALCESLILLCTTLKAELLLQVGGKGASVHHKIPHKRLHTPADILQEVSR